MARLLFFFFGVIDVGMNLDYKVYGDGDIIGRFGARGTWVMFCRPHAQDFFCVF